ncbi:hypothetical protein DSO57_1026213 [Entomophthora muscae]|uniref:Uncharacterized protein n=1 Tax=Entomophthora muscae TaxID=34485 RepID=A0ACC2T280_9FUNG|nr:hypothetical protein DSO57_1026213 [Entomophthora muscae]
MVNSHPSLQRSSYEEEASGLPGAPQDPNSYRLPPSGPAVLLSCLGAYFFLGRFNPLLGCCWRVGELPYTGTVSLPVGSLVTVLNPSATIHPLWSISQVEGCLTLIHHQALEELKQKLVTALVLQLSNRNC